MIGDDITAQMSFGENDVSTQSASAIARVTHPLYIENASQVLIAGSNRLFKNSLHV